MECKIEDFCFKEYDCRNAKVEGCGLGATAELAVWGDPECIGEWP